MRWYNNWNNSQIHRKSANEEKETRPNLQKKGRFVTPHTDRSEPSAWIFEKKIHRSVIDEFLKSDFEDAYFFIKILRYKTQYRSVLR